MYEAFKAGIYEVVRDKEGWKDPIYAATYNVLVDNMPYGTKVGDWIENGVKDAIIQLKGNGLKR